MEDDKKMEIDEWEVYFLENPMDNNGAPYLDLRMRIRGRRENGKINITKEEFDNLKEDLRNLGRWRNFKKLKKDLD